MREQLLAAEKVKAIDWRQDALWLLDQRLLPGQESWLAFRDAAAVAKAIASMLVRGAPAIGITAAYGLVLGVRQRLAQDGGDWRAGLKQDTALLAASRPTAVNLFWALDRMSERAARIGPDEDPLAALQTEAQAIHESDREANLAMVQFGVELLARNNNRPQNLLTHCNTGALATGGFGTALGVIRGAWLQGLVAQVYVDETRPWLQGSRLTAWELVAEGIPTSLLADSAAAHLMKVRGIDWVIVGADRIAANGDVANKIGTYQLAISAMHHGARFMVVAPSSSVDMQTASGDDIRIEERPARELLAVAGQRVAAEVNAFNPVFDVTPVELIDAIVTERGMIERPNGDKLAALMSQHSLH